MSRPVIRIGQRREFQILLPIALFILVCLSTFTLFAYRSSIRLLSEEKERELIRQGRGVAALAARGSMPSVHDLRRLLPVGVEASIFDEQGEVLLSTSERVLFLENEMPAPEYFSARLPLEYQGRTLQLQLDQQSRLAQGRQSLRILVPTVLGINGLVVFLVLLYLRSFLAPFDRLVARAQQVQPTGADTTDEVSFLIETFDRALDALARPSDDDLLALQRTLAPSLESGVLLCDNQARVIALNGVGAQLLAIEPPVPESDLEEILAPHPRLCQLLLEAMRALRGEHRTECEIEVGGVSRPLGLTVHVLRRDDGDVRGFLVLFIDLTSIRKQNDEKRLAETLADLGEIAAGVAHELRNSVATLHGYLTLIERGGDAESIADFTSEIRRETEHLRRVVNDFLAFSRPGTARMEDVDLAELVRRVAADPALEGGQVVVHIADRDGEYLVRGDSQLLERALRNLVHNAVQATDRAGEKSAVEIALDRDGPAFRIRIDDRGTGIAPEIRERLFHPFVSGRPGGVGLGLALALRIVHLHGGDLSLEDRPDGGARALAILPAGDPDT